MRKVFSVRQVPKLEWSSATPLNLRPWFINICYLYLGLVIFGLESWNQAWNNVYWVFSLVLLVPIASKRAQTVETPDLAQIVLQYDGPALIAAPMVATIIARQQRLPDLWGRI
jgi:hypothetical protein